MPLQRLRAQLAERLVRQCVRVNSKDTVTIATTPQTMELAEEIAVKCFEEGADALLNLYTDKYYSSYMRLLSKENLSEPSKFCVALTEASTVEVNLGWQEDPDLLRGVPSEKVAAMFEGEQKAHEPLSTQKGVRIADLVRMQVTKEKAKAYRLDPGRWSRACYRAASTDYLKMNQVCKRVASILENGREVRITATGGTEVECELGHRKVYANDGVIDDEDLANQRYRISIPAGDAVVAPVENSANGRVVSNNPLHHSGKVIKRVEWNFEHGRVTSFQVDKGGETLKQQYESSGGHKDRLAYLRIGVNPDAAYGYTMDSIVAGAVGVGIGGNVSVGGENVSPFAMGITLKGATMEVDGKALVESGVFQL